MNYFQLLLFILAIFFLATGVRSDGLAPQWRMGDDPDYRRYGDACVFSNGNELSMTFWDQEFGVDENGHYKQMYKGHARIIAQVFWNGQWRGSIKMRVVVQEDESARVYHGPRSYLVNPPVE